MLKDHAAKRQDLCRRFPINPPAQAQGSFGLILLGPASF